MKAIALISGGLDSTLAAKLMQNLGIEIIGLYFLTPFAHHDLGPSPLAELELKNIVVTDDFLEMVKNPRHGYGSNLNPCIDCKIFMLNKAREAMREYGASFVITGEVLGQRPMSQNRQALELIEKESGLQGLLLRPLSAKLLTETQPEKQGWVRRQDLLNFSGRSRKPQMALAHEFNLASYPNPAGGCLLTDPRFTDRAKDLLRHKQFNLENIELLKIGRHFRISADTKLIVGREEKENLRLEKMAKEKDYLFMPATAAGPTALGRGEFNEELIKLASGIVCRYCDLNGSTVSDINYKRIPESQERGLKITAIGETELAKLVI